MLKKWRKDARIHPELVGFRKIATSIFKRYAHFFSNSNLTFFFSEIKVNGVKMPLNVPQGMQEANALVEGPPTGD